MCGLVLCPAELLSLALLKIHATESKCNSSQYARTHVHKMFCTLTWTRHLHATAWTAYEHTCDRRRIFKCSLVSTRQSIQCSQWPSSSPNGPQPYVQAGRSGRSICRIEMVRRHYVSIGILLLRNVQASDWLPLWLHIIIDCVSLINIQEKKKKMKSMSDTQTSIDSHAKL